MSEVIVLDYDPNWPHVFKTLRASIWAAVADIAISIEHVGSTAVPGLAAKPVIDIDIVVPEREVSIAIQRLTTLGYHHRGDLGVPQREAFRAPSGSPPHHLYLCPSNSPALANHLAIRDYLRANLTVARAYGDLKKRLALEFANDIDGYVEAKTRFLIDILRELGFSESDLTQIVRINRRPAMPEVVERDAVRAILVTPQHEVLLLRIRLPDVREPFWIAPGGGLETGETTEECLRRELREELGLDHFALGPLVWLRQHTFNFGGRRICQRERYHIVDVEKFEPHMSDEVEAAVVERLQWWHARDLFSVSERLTPLSLANIVACYLRDGAPTEPLELEVLVD